jgi:chorismate mutase
VHHALPRCPWRDNSQKRYRRIQDIASAFFTVTSDLTAAFPARAAREMGWQHVALLDAQEIPVPGSLSRCVRVLIHWNTEKPQAEIRHVYLRGATALRPDLKEEKDQ